MYPTFGIHVKVVALPKRALPHDDFMKNYGKRVDVSLWSGRETGLRILQFPEYLWSCPQLS